MKRLEEMSNKELLETFANGCAQHMPSDCVVDSETLYKAKAMILEKMNCNDSRKSNSAGTRGGRL